MILTYTLEPAGSHGVWGLDDHSFAPYIFGSAQLGPPITSPTAPTPLQGSLDSAPEPEAITSKSIVAEHQSSNMYFSAIQFIFDVKKGPFWEHSPILYNISGIKDGWGKINKGMLKMYDAEVLSKFPVVQHFPFGRFFKWERDPDAATPLGPSVHALQQPLSSDSGVSMNSSTGTPVPWAQQASSSSQPQTGMPSTKAPWASAHSGGMQGRDSNTAAPWASTSSRMPAPSANSRDPPVSGLGGSSYGRMAPPGAARKLPDIDDPLKRRDD